MLATCSI